MEAKELMIGDYLRYRQDFPDTHLQGKVVKVCGIRGMVDVRTVNDYVFRESVHWLEPIPLTPEILEKNGMKPFEVDRLLDKHSSAKWWAKGGDFFVKQYNFKHNNYEPTYSVGCNNHSLIIGLKYVHELQNALRLCGIEKEITI